jgi:hypothetical protein
LGKILELLKGPGSTGFQSASLCGGLETESLFQSETSRAIGLEAEGKPGESDGFISRTI